MREHGQDPGDGVEVRDETNIVQVVEKLCNMKAKGVAGCRRHVFILPGTIKVNLPGSWNA